MPLHPALVDLVKKKLEARIPPWEMPIEEVREGFEELFEKLRPDDKSEIFIVEDLNLDLKGRTLKARYYCPSDKRSLPIIVYFHGGGFNKGSINSSDSLVRRLSSITNSVVLSVDYRPTPEYAYPSQVEDAYESLMWAYNRASYLRANPEMLIVAGSSAGGTLAANVSFMAKERLMPKIALQILDCPWLDFAFSSSLYQDLPKNVLIFNLDDIKWYRDLYLKHYEDPLDPKISPLFQNDFSDLPPTIMLSAEYDCLNEENYQYVEKLKAAGVKVFHQDFLEMLHCFMAMGKLVPVEADQAFTYIKESVDHILYGSI